MNTPDRTLLISLALTTGLLSGAWVWLSEQLQLISWVGFLGCTTYFSIPRQGLLGLIRSMAANVSGVLWATCASLFTLFSDPLYSAVIGTGLVSFVMCIQSRLRLLCYVPGSFIGASALFGAQAEEVEVIATLCLGGVMGFMMQSSGQLLVDLYLRLTRRYKQERVY
ncbi:DUF1097 domain-containing protein [Vibrio japonicus]|uniref:DUF1097 domain-containing protein n=1 Tax=Vibrio japonicus TaxID=1824638 RepID=A0ABY5LPQ0_9VIBR|nr:DUF1097 domain-containing protein [Vibrio japonicus]UUM33115.1 DUF1097 domain-containing protein [Vibrio japonicus]